MDEIKEKSGFSRYNVQLKMDWGDMDEGFKEMVNLTATLNNHFKKYFFYRQKNLQRLELFLKMVTNASLEVKKNFLFDQQGLYILF